MTAHKEVLMEQIRYDNLTLKYGVKTLFENLTFSVNQGDYLYIVRENGSEKKIGRAHV